MIVEIEDTKRIPKAGERYLDYSYGTNRVEVATADDKKSICHFIVTRVFDSGLEAARKAHDNALDVAELTREQIEAEIANDYTDGEVTPYQWS